MGPAAEGRLPKPRHQGLTLVMDKGLSPSQLEAFLEVAAPYVDLVKLGFGTAALYRPGTVREKVLLARARGVEVYPGGTLLEAAILQDRVRHLVRELEAWEVRVVEVSDGTVSVPPDYRQRLIRALTRLGFRVLAEVGKKHPEDQVPVELLCRQIQEDLEAGAWKVIVEGRESGRGVGIYRDDGSVRERDLEALAGSVPDPGLLIWEAPLRSQQVALIRRFGPNVNLGNVPPEEVLSVEALRVGLRGDTLRDRARREGGWPAPSWP